MAAGSKIFVEALTGNLVRIVFFGTRGPTRRRAGEREAGGTRTPGYEFLSVPFMLHGTDVRAGLAVIGAMVLMGAIPIAFPELAADLAESVSQR